LSEAERAHVQGCAACQQEQALAEAMRASGGPGPSESLDARILEAAHAALAEQPTAGTWRRPWMAGMGLAVLTATIVGLAYRARFDLSRLPAQGVAFNLALLAVAFALAGRAAFAPGLRPRGRWTASLLALGAAAGLLLFPGASHALPGNPMGCFFAVLAVSVAPLLALFGLLRSRTRDPRTGACAGLAAGALGEAALFLHCPNSGAVHLLSTHLLAWAVLAAAGAFLVARFPRRLVSG
jgi:hypothetical protein